MVKVFILLKIRPASVSKVESSLRSMVEVREFYLLTGRYDGVVILEFPTVGEALECISTRIMKIEGIWESETLVELPPF